MTTPVRLMLALAVMLALCAPAAAQTNPFEPSEPPPPPVCTICPPGPPGPPGPPYVPPTPPVHAQLDITHPLLVGATLYTVPSRIPSLNHILVRNQAAGFVGIIDTTRASLCVRTAYPQGRLPERWSSIAAVSETEFGILDATAGYLCVVQWTLAEPCVPLQ